MRNSMVRIGVLISILFCTACDLGGGGGGGGTAAGQCTGGNVCCDVKPDAFSAPQLECEGRNACLMRGGTPTSSTNCSP
jgi:hypothetical protein